MIITKDILDELMMVWLLLVCLPVHAQQKHDDTLDDVLQYVPYAKVLALKGLRSPGPPCFTMSIGRCRLGYRWRGMAWLRSQP